MPVTITALSNKVKQPKGGYLPVKLFKEIHYNTKNELFPDENVSKSLIGTTVDNMTRILLGAKPKKVFQPAINGMMAAKVDIFGDSFDLIDEVTGLDDDSILAAFQLSIYEAIYRNGYRTSVNLENKLTDNHTRQPYNRKHQRNDQSLTSLFQTTRTHYRCWRTFVCKIQRRHHLW